MTLRLIALTTILSCFAGEASAQQSDPSKPLNEQESLADQKFFEGKAKARELKWEEALLLFEQSWHLKPNYDSAGNLGQVALKLGLYAKAATYLDRCLRMFPASGDKNQRAQIAALLRDATSHVATVRFTIGHKEGELVLDRATELGPAKGPLSPVYVNPGTHVVQLRQGNQIVAEQSFLAVASASQQVEVTLPHEPELKPTEQPGVPRARAANDSMPSPFNVHADEDEGRSLVPIFIGGGIGAASFIAAGVLLNSANRHLEDAKALQSRLQASAGDHACLNATNGEACSHLHDSLASADRRFNWSYALFGVGGASVLGALTYAIWPVFSGGHAERTHAQRPRVPVQFQLGRGAAILSCQTQF